MLVVHGCLKRFRIWISS